MGLFDKESPNFNPAIQEIKQGARSASKKLNPWVSSGRAAQNQYMAQLGLGQGPVFDVTTLPGYQRALDQGLESVNRGAAGTGMLMSGSRMKGLQDRGQDIFGQYYGDYMNRLSGLNQMGMGAATQQGNWGMMGAQGASNLMAQQAQADAAASGSWGADLLGAVAPIAGMVAGGPIGAGISSWMFGGDQQDDTQQPPAVDMAGGYPNKTPQYWSYT